MTTTFVPTNPAVSITANRSTTQRPLWLVGLAAGVLAATANVVVAAVARALDVSLKLTGSGGHVAKAIPIGGFATMTLAGAAVGILLAAGSGRWARSPATRFVRLAVVGTVLSLVPDAINAADRPTMLVLWLTHVVAAAVIVSLLAARLRATAS
jgi:hypothetical protein